MADVTPFLTASAVGTLWRPLVGTEVALADLLVASASAWIRRKIADAGLPALAVDDPNAKLVVLDVVRAAIEGAAPNRARSFSRTTGQRSTSWTYDEAAKLLEWLPNHYELLGLPQDAGKTALGVGYFPIYPSCGYAEDRPW